MKPAGPEVHSSRFLIPEVVRLGLMDWICFSISHMFSLGGPASSLNSLFSFSNHTCESSQSEFLLLLMLFCPLEVHTLVNRSQAYFWIYATALWPPPSPIMNLKQPSVGTHSTVLLFLFQTTGSLLFTCIFLLFKGAKIINKQHYLFNSVILVLRTI